MAKIFSLSCKSAQCSSHLLRVTGLLDIVRQKMKIQNAVPPHLRTSTTVGQSTEGACCKSQHFSNPCILIRTTSRTSRQLCFSPDPFASRTLSLTWKFHRVIAGSSKSVKDPSLLPSRRLEVLVRLPSIASRCELRKACYTDTQQVLNPIKCSVQFC